MSLSWYAGAVVRALAYRSAGVSCCVLVPDFAHLQVLQSSDLPLPARRYVSQNKLHCSKRRRKLDNHVKSLYWYTLCNLLKTTLDKRPLCHYWSIFIVFFLPRSIYTQLSYYFKSQTSLLPIVSCSISLSININNGKIENICMTFIPV